MDHIPRDIASTSSEREITPLINVATVLIIVSLTEHDKIKKKGIVIAVGVHGSSSEVQKARCGA